MIYESGPWKDRLLRDAKRLRGLMRPTRTPLRRNHAIEQVLFLSAFCMRKLWEAHKISTSWGKRAVSCRRYKLRADVPTILKRDEIADFYDLESPTLGTVTPPDLCNLLIHSFVFLPDFTTNGRLAGLFFASDRSRRGHLIWISARDFADLLSDTGLNDPSRASFTVNALGQYDVWMGESLPLRNGRRRGSRLKS
jgi:hypothetical protein